MTTLNSYVKSSHMLEVYSWNIICKLRTFTADDLHILESEIKAYHRDRRVIGAILKSFEHQGLIRKLGYEPSGRRECHGRPIVRWEVIK